MRNASQEADRLQASVLLAQGMMPAKMDSARVLLEVAYPLEDAPNLRQQAQYFNVWGLYYWFRRDRQASISWFSRTLSLPGDASILDLKAAAANNTGTLFFRLGDPDNARIFLLRALEIDMRRDCPTGVAKTKYDLSRLYASQSQYELAALDSLEGNYGGFTRNYVRGIELRDSIWSQENRSRIAELQIIHETEQKEGDIEQLRQKEQLRQLRMTIVTAGSGLVLVLLLLFIFYLRKRQILVRQQYQLKQQQVESKLEANHLEHTGKALSLARSEKLIRQLKKDIQGLMDTSEGDNGKGLQSVMRLLKSQDNSQQLWKEFETRFNELNEGFISRLTARYPSLSPAEIRLCALLRLQMSTKEIADMLNRSPRTIEYTRNRVRKRMDLKTGDNLVQHLLKI